MATPILCFVGRSNSGKTTVIERLIPELTRVGYRIATVKHAGHGFELDTEGKDSWRHKQAGASAVVVLSKGSMAMFADVSEEIKVEEIRDRFLDSEIDLIIAEGWKSEDYPKIAVVREHLGEVTVSTEGLLAIVSMKPIQSSVPCFDRDDIQNLAELIVRHYPKRHAP
ncbi:MAG: molybdopterin-guanine dinucleotide biosynthesis protein B [Nitrospinae bacterium]|nr:molybdopterin-guanine dinucleotide biosynthesis protein B [Nitrospinota bacterium]MCZ6580710.1 molybdopterin-guanine dinucleotide biosynthesis protein B [Nitrospirota bacterium]